MSLLFCDVVKILEKIKMINKCVHYLLMSIRMEWTDDWISTDAKQMCSQFGDLSKNGIDRY